MTRDRSEINSQLQIQTAPAMGATCQSRHTSAPPTVEQLAAELAPLFEPHDVYELRALDVETVHWEYGPRREIHSALFYGHEVAVMAREVLRLSGRCKGIYATVNPVRSTGRFAYLPHVQRMKWAKATTEDEQIQVRTGLLLDIDRPKTPSRKLAATDAELARVFELRQRVHEYLVSEGFPSRPAGILSGNGAYLKYRTEPQPLGLPLPDDDALKLVLHHLADKFDGPDGEIDTGVFNPSRIYRLPGGLNTKGKPTDERPHRVARLDMVPDNSQVVPFDLLRELARRAPAVERKATVAVPAGGAISSKPAGIPTTALSTVDARTDRRIRGHMPFVPVCVENNGGDLQLFDAACDLVRGWCLTPEAAFPYLAEYNSRCLPPWDESRLWYKLHEAQRSSTREWGYLLNRERPAEPVKPTDLSDLQGPPFCAECTEVACGKPRERDCEKCGVRLPLLADKALREEVGHANVKATEPHNQNNELIRKLVGKAPHLGNCPRRKKRRWKARGGTESLNAVVHVACDCWGTCFKCRTRLRWLMKKENVPFAILNGTHTFRGTHKELNALCKKLDRADIAYGCYWVSLGGDQRAAVFSLALGTIDRAPTDLTTFTAATGEGCGCFLAKAIDDVPPDLEGGHRHGKRGELEWNPAPVSETDAIAEASGEPEEQCEGEELVAETEEAEPFFEDCGDHMVPTVEPDDLESFLLEIDQEQADRGIPEHERVNPRRGSLCDGHEGGAIEDSLIWRTPDDPDLIKRIERKLYEGSFVIPRESPPTRFWGSDFNALAH